MLSPVISIGRLGAADAAGYYLDRQAGCELDYYTGAGEEHGRWLGDGARTLGLDGVLDEAGEQALRALLAGSATDGQQLVGPVLRADPRSRLDAAPLVRAVAALGVSQPGAELFLPSVPSSQLAAATERIAAGRSATLPVEIVRRVAEVAGLDPVALYRGADGTDRYTAALSYAGSQVDARRVGLDVTVSAPKSVSFLFALGDPQVAAAARAAHAVAVGEVVAYLQRHAATAVRGHHGGGRRAARIGTDGLIVAAFDHRTSRAGDPQLHTHLVIPNLVRGADGRWSAMDTGALYRHARTASSVYHAVLRGELTRTLGVAWEPVQRGIAEIDGIPRWVIEMFSKRRAQITAALDARGATGVKAAQAACLATRPAKTHEPAPALRERWRAEAAEQGLDGEVIRRLTGVMVTPETPSLPELAGLLFGPDGVTKDATTFTRQDLAQAVCETLPAGMPVRLADIDALVVALITHPDVLPVVAGETRERRYTTRELVHTEQVALHLATQVPARPAGTTRVLDVPGLLARSGLSEEQQAMVHTLVTSGRRVDVVAGPAGCGKTAALNTAHQLWADSDTPVLGAAVSWLAAQQLETATGIRCGSLTQTLHRADRDGLPAGVVLVLDEASLVNTRTLARLLHQVHAADGKLVLVGDPNQLPEIGAGGIFTTLTRRDATIHLSGNQRQHQPWERDALRRFQAGDVAGALDDYLAHDRIHLAATKPELLAQLAADYTSALSRGEDVLVLAVRRSDVALLNTTIREHLLDAQLLGGDELVVPLAGDDRNYRAGDHVMVTANEPRLGLVNGSRGTVTASDTHRGLLTVEFDGRGSVTVDRDWLAAGHLAHAYAVTVHKAQGVTVDTTLIYGLGPLTREHGYVALSRGRDANHLYIAADDGFTPDCGRTTQPVAETEQQLTAELLDHLLDTRSHDLASTQLADWNYPNDRDDDHLFRLIRDDERHYGRSR